LAVFLGIGWKLRATFGRRAVARNEAKLRARAFRVSGYAAALSSNTTEGTAKIVVCFAKVETTSNATTSASANPARSSRAPRSRNSRERTERAPAPSDRVGGVERFPMTLTVADTAYSIAAIRADEHELFEDPYAKHFAAAGAHAEEGTRRYLSLPFFRDGVRLRTRYIDDAVRDAVKDGFEQLVLLGAGFDARALRMPELANARVFEVDSPEQLDRKREILERAGVRIPESNVYVGSEFTIDGFTRALAAAAFDRDRDAFFVWEGVIGYIGDAEIDATLRFMAGAAPRSRVVFTFGMESYAERVSKLGFTLREEHTLDAVWRCHLPGEPDAGASYSRVAIIEALRSRTG
jgi:methyltransferase (TIGR00027 family)